MRIGRRLQIPCSLLVLASACALLGCDPVGRLRVYAVKDGPGAQRLPADDVQAWMECPNAPGHRFDLVREGGPGELAYREIPAINPDCVLFVRRAQGPVRRFRAGDLCVERVDRGERQCRTGFLYVALPDGEPAPVDRGR